MSVVIRGIREELIAAIEKLLEAGDDAARVSLSSGPGVGECWYEVERRIDEIATDSFEDGYADGHGNGYDEGLSDGHAAAASDRECCRD